jgi:hypothetical protein
MCISTATVTQASVVLAHIQKAHAAPDDSSKEYYVTQQDTGITEIDGPFTKAEAYAFTKKLLERWTITRWFDEKEDGG